MIGWPMGVLGRGEPSPIGGICEPGVRDAPRLSIEPEPVEKEAEAATPSGSGTIGSAPPTAAC